MGLRASIFKDAKIGTCANGGISDQLDEVTIVNAEGPFEPTAEAPAVEVTRGAFPGIAKVVVVDDDVLRFNRDTDRTAGPMFGGSYIATSDSRFREAIEKIIGGPFYGAVPLHDRYETPEQNRALSA